MNKMKKVPEIRFKEFEEEWVQNKLGDCFLERVERSAIGELISVTINNGVVKAADTGRADSSSADKSNYKKVEVGDIAYNSMRMWQGACGYSSYNGILSPAYTVVTPTNGVDVKFYYYLFKRTDSLCQFRINSQGLTSDTWNLKYPSFSKIYCMVPKESEQKRNAELFLHIDNLIRKIEQKLEKLRNIKQSLLNQMFVNVNRGGYAPLIRFNGYNNKWIMLTLNDISERITRKNTNNESSLPLTVSAQDGLINQNDFFNSRIASKDVSKYYLIKDGEFAYNKSSSDGYPFGAVKRLDRYKMGVLSTLYIIFALNKEKIDSDFLSIFFETDKWYEHISQRAAEGARNHGLLNISSEDFLDLKILTPKSKNEQILIAGYVSALDRLVEETSSKLTKLRCMKQSLLQKMFV